MHIHRFRHIVFITLMILIISLTVVTFGHLLNFVIMVHQILPPFTIFFSALVAVITYYLYRNHQVAINREVTKLYSPRVKKIAIPIIHIPLLIFTTLLSHLVGASVGREGVAVQIGGTFGSYFNQIKTRWDIHIPARVIVTTAMATGFAALFGMPFTAAFFAIEISQFYKRLPLKWLPLPFLGSLVAAQFSYHLGINHMHYHVSFANLTPSLFFAFILLLTLILVAATLYLFVHHNLAPVLKKYIASPLPRIIGGSLILACLLFVFKLDSIQGLGSNLITQSFTQQATISPSLPLLKILFTLGFLALGFKGGEVTPIFAIGAMLGAVAATLFNLPAPLFAIIGLAAFFSATTKTYIAPLLIVAEVTTPLAMPFLLPILIGIYFLTPKRGIYQQVDTTEKPFLALWR